MAPSLCLKCLIYNNTITIYREHIQYIVYIGLINFRARYRNRCDSRDTETLVFKITTVMGEKKVEVRLKREVEKRGGWCLKFLPFVIKGLPDRIVFPGKGVIDLVETKSDIGTLSHVQKYVHRKLLKLGVKIWIIRDDVSLKEYLKFRYGGI